MAGKNLRNLSGKKGVGMSAPGRPKGIALAPPTGMPNPAGKPVMKNKPMMVSTSKPRGASRGR